MVLSNVAEKTGIPPGDVRTVYDALVDEIIGQAVDGSTVVLNGFGTFYVQSHKGHPIRFESFQCKGTISDYLVFKFSASHSMNDKLRKLVQTG